MNPLLNPLGELDPIEYLEWVRLMLRTENGRNALRKLVPVAVPEVVWS